MEPSTKHLNPLTGLRGIAALSILLGHGISSSFIYNGVNAYQPFAARLCYFAMSLFFILSGFVIHCNYAKMIRTKGLLKGGYDFFIARFARLYPLYALAIIFTLDGIPSFYFHNQQKAEFAYLTLTQSWFNLQTIMFPPAWSISTECFFYLSFIMLFPLFEKIKKPILALSLLLVLTFLFLPKFMNLQADLLKDKSGWAFYFSPFSRVFEFIAGVLASQIYIGLESKQTSIKINPLIFSAIFLCVGWCLLVLFFDPLSKNKFSILISSFVYAPAIAPLITLCCHFDTILSRALSSRFLLFMGEISYSLYLWQFTVISGVAASFSYHPHNKINNLAYINSCIKIMIVMSITTFVAYGSYHLFEKPTRRFIRRRLSLSSNPKITPVSSEIIPGSILG